jgi:hypothetical protein
MLNNFWKNKNVYVGGILCCGPEPEKLLTSY